MKRHTQIYMDHFDYGMDDFISCEICENKAVDIHHINARGIGGDYQGKKDVIENLMAVCRKCHVDYGDKQHFKDMLKEIHKKRMDIFAGK